MEKHFKPRKQLGQHFLIDDQVIHQIVVAVHPQPEDQIIEIGPGFGALTTAILPLVKSMNAVEYDREVIPCLKAACEKLGELHIYYEDILKFDLHTIFQPYQKLRVVGNLPYNILWKE